MSHLDAGILSLLNQFSRHSWTFDTSVAFVSDSSLLKGGIVVGLLWWAWFQPSKDEPESRATILATILGSVLAVAVNCALVCLLPHRARPLHEPLLQFTSPYGVDPVSLHAWSSFPSDHAVLFSSLAIGLGWAAPALRTLLVLHALLVVLLPRLYLGFHYPSDILGGALLGTSIVWLVNRSSLKPLCFRWATAWKARWPGFFYASLFLLTFQIATLFGDARAIAGFSVHLICGILLRLAGAR